MATNRIDTPAKRLKLEIRREPFWHSFARGRSLGFRKTNSGGTWVVKQFRKQSRLGDESDFSYGEALDKAMAITKATETGDPKDALTIHDVLKHYQQKKASEHGEQKSLKTLKFYENNLPISLLNARAVEVTLETFNKWKHGCVYQPTDNPDSPENLEKIRSSKVTFNRKMTPLMAALRYTFGTSYRGGWSELKKFKKVDSPRDLFLTVEQVKAWLDNTESEFHNLTKACMLTGSRTGELKSLTVGAFEVLNGQGLLNIKHSKTGPRLQRLSDQATEFFKIISKDRPVNEFMLLNPKGKQWTNRQIAEQVDQLRIKKILPDNCVLYSLRHFYISRALLAGFNPLALAKNLGTSVDQFEKSYAKFMDDDVHNMLNSVKTQS